MRRFYRNRPKRSSPGYPERRIIWGRCPHCGVGLQARSAVMTSVAFSTCLLVSPQGACENLLLIVYRCHICKYAFNGDIVFADQRIGKTSTVWRNS